MENRLQEFKVHHLCWEESESHEVQLSKTKKEAYLCIDPEADPCSSSGVRCSSGFAEGEHYWEVTFLEPLCGQSVMLGVATEDALLYSKTEPNLLGCDRCSWGLSYKGTLHHNGTKKTHCDPFFSANTTIGVHLNLQQGTLCFYRDGGPMGEVINGLDKLNSTFFPVVSSSSPAEVAIGRGLRRQTSLFEKCSLQVKRCCSSNDVNRLPIPKRLHVYLR